MINVQDIVTLQMETVSRWHHEPIDNPYSDLEQAVCTQHQFNYQLWHQEDIARSRDVTDEKIAEVKRAIDGFNQNRNDWIEKVDDYITELVQSRSVKVQPDARLNTETPGSVIDRLSILSLRIYHMEEQLERSDVNQEHLDSVNHKIAICRLQQDELSNSLQELLDDIFAGRKRHRTYRQLKMYNDPSLNPYLYKKQVA
ncbi:DUF4254 domain-containing protein [Mariniblastus fucicola]|nr:DUF4254 domain-containing protein [Mariniblastus fucicola]